MKSNSYSPLDDSLLSRSDCDEFVDEKIFKNNLNIQDLNNNFIHKNSAPNHKLISREVLIGNRNKMEFALENFLNDELIELSNKNNIFDNIIKPGEKAKDNNHIPQISQIPFNLKKTSLKILTETSELNLNEQEEKIQSHIFPSTPTDYIHSNQNFYNNYLKTSAMKSMNSISNWQHSTSGGVSTIKMKKSKSRLRNVYELSMMSERSVYSKCTLRKAEEYLECLRTKEEKEICSEVEMNNGTLNCYLMTDQTIAESSHIKKKWNGEREIQINQAICFNIQGKPCDSHNLQDENLIMRKLEHVNEKKSIDFKCLLNRGDSFKRVVKINIRIIFSLLFAICLIMILIYVLVTNSIKTNPLICTYPYSNASLNQNLLIPLIKDNKYEYIFHRRISEIYNLN